MTQKSALVTGGSKGIGRAVATRLAHDGALVAVHYGSDEAAAKDTVATIEENGGQAFAVQATLGVDGDAATLFDRLSAELRERTGEVALDILVNNAATGAGSITSATPEEFDRVFAVNVKAPFFLVQRLVPVLRDGGRIVNISSADTRIALPFELAYSMTKGALDVFTRSLAQELGQRGITVNGVAPGPTPTDSTAHIFADERMRAGTADASALRRIAEPADIADVVAFLASADSRWVTGQVVDATGGTFLGPAGV
ncbi:SDR family oxidoreductase [Amycolatopsis rubida]|uniref:3-oxoacyl-[acyl-carrier protein] reductase n=1 Tax=Amycolatopsis rubida TaxID=112413 RepID=A0A1I5ZK64_9PSEU|nr:MULTISPECIES: SDR family oxidoreductase [Amycolatopsis]MYW91598.1 SDR family oxidoreductase [Amycolatopsis rubida]NEC56583.1 SDR family oxidoreductase [Amycolatopsis rubida]OAP25604.1 3-oxoacyl-[acyl-carrier-protein] reductase FabG [Amycolatopsis sp. M39]SFQ56856.1 3-oxoacyl-[acyl-carrier protein] reductase [Amycolatopsis rubida]